MALRYAHNAQAPKLIRAPDGTHFWNLSQSPAASSVTTALHFGVLSGQLSGTAAICQGRETGADTLIDTSGAVRAGDVASRTGAHVAASSVRALSSVAHTGDAAAFIDIFTLVAGLTLTMSSGTFTLVGAHSVDAVPSGTQSWHGLALIHILAGSSSNVGDKSSSAGVGLSGTLFTRVAPGSTNGGTAEGLGANDATELPLTHLIIDLSEAGARPVVSLALRASETIDTGTSVGPNTAPTVLAAVLTDRLTTVTASVALWT